MKDYAQKLSKMIACETISARGQTDLSKFYRFHKVLEELFPTLHTMAEKHDFNGSLLWKITGNSNTKSPMLLMSHMDVVEASGEWPHPPFSGHNDGQRIWGRGTLDTKGSLFAILQAVEEKLQQGWQPDYDLYIASSCTEEIGGEGGVLTAKFLEEQGVKLGLLIDEGGAILPEPVAGVKGDFAMIGVVEKGGANLKFTARSKGGHASAPPKNSPIPRLAQFVAEVERHDPFKVQLSKEVRTMLKVMAPKASGLMGFAFGHVGLMAPVLCNIMPKISPTAGAMLKTTIAFTMQSGSQGANVLPLEASVTANMRFIPHQNMEESIALIKGIAAKYDIETEVLNGNPSTAITDINGPGYELVKSVLEQLFPQVTVSPYVMVAATDSRFYAKVSSHTIRFAPIYMDNQQFASVHAAGENIFISSLEPAVHFYQKIMEKY